MALLNAGLVTGLVLAGWLASHSGYPAAGILLFAALAFIPACMQVFSSGNRTPGRSPFRPCSVSFPLYGITAGSGSPSSVLIGITGVVTSLYPQFSGASSENLGIWIAGMSIATIVAVLVAPGHRYRPSLLSAGRQS